MKINFPIASYRLTFTTLQVAAPGRDGISMEIPVSVTRTNQINVAGLPGREDPEIFDRAPKSRAGVLVGPETDLAIARTQRHGGQIQGRRGTCR